MYDYDTMIPFGNLELGHLIDTPSYLATPILKSCGLLITYSWICHALLGHVLFRLGLDLGLGLGTCLDWGL